MDTHGPHFSSSRQVFSTEANEAEEWDKARYEDAILSFDGSVEKIYKHLEEHGQLDNTILVIYTDHGFKYTVWNRIPIIIHFPNDAHAGTREHNIQVIDVPATLLDYLDIPQPEWMTGLSFLNDEPPVDRQIVSITAGSPSKIKPPFYQIKIVQVLVCQKWYTLNVQENKWDTGNVSGHTAKCSLDLLPPEEDMRQKILDYLEKYGYDVSSLTN
jgi:arylsulfatase A-like enzyme